MLVPGVKLLSRLFGLDSRRGDIAWMTCLHRRDSRYKLLAMLPLVAVVTILHIVGNATSFASAAVRFPSREEIFVVVATNAPMGYSPGIGNDTAFAGEVLGRAGLMKSSGTWLEGTISGMDRHAFGWVPSTACVTLSSSGALEYFGRGNLPLPG